MDIPGRASLYSFFYIIQIRWIFKEITYKQHHKNIHLRSATEVTCWPQREKTCLSWMRTTKAHTSLRIVLFKYDYKKKNMPGQVQGAHCNIYLVKVKTTRDIFSSERCKLLLVLSIYTSKHYLQNAHVLKR